MSHAPELFYRPELAERIVKNVLTVAVGSATSSGVFLAAPCAPANRPLFART